MYTELQVTTNFSFLRGASHPGDLVLQAAVLGQKSIAVTDRNSLAGVVRAYAAARETGIRLITGARLDLTDGISLLTYPTDRAAYGRLSRLITLGRRRAPKGECELYRDDVLAYGEGLIFIALPEATADDDACRQITALHIAFPDAVYLAGHNLCRGDDRQQLARRAALAQRAGIPLVATNDVRMHARGRRPLLDVLTCIREKCTIDTAGLRLDANAERHLKSTEEMTRLFEGYEDALARTQEIAERCTFSLDELRYEYPDEVSPDGCPPQQRLTELTWEGARSRYPGGAPPKVRAQLEHELALIDELHYAPYFLTVHDIVVFARQRNILCQGRGSAANSAVCYCLGITSVDPARLDLLFERFISAERDEPPDIDVDFEHERREEVIQYIYNKYGRDRAGMTGVVIRYRSRSAVREVGKALGLSGDTVTLLAGQVHGRSGDGVDEARVREVGLNPTEPRIRMALALTEQIIGFPRHLSQHVGGFVITRGRLDELAPVENAAMAGPHGDSSGTRTTSTRLASSRSTCWRLGMLSCIHRKGFALLRRHHYGQA